MSHHPSRAGVGLAQSAGREVETGVDGACAVVGACVGWAAAAALVVAAPFTAVAAPVILGNAMGGGALAGAKLSKALRGRA